MAIAKLSLLLSLPPSSPLRAVAVAAVVSIALRMNPSTFLPYADRCATSGGPPSGILRGASSPPPLLPPLPPAAADDDDQRSVDAGRDLSSGGGVLLIFSSKIQPTDQLTNSTTHQPTNFAFARLIFQSRSYKFSTPNYPLTKKRS
jgi:hypothetical protein